MKMLKTLNYVWVIVFIMISYPCTSIAESDTPSAEKIWKEPATDMEFVWVPGGCYEMGCGKWTNDCFRDEKPVHEVCVDGFWMGKTEVTQKQWEQVMEVNPSKFKKGDNYPVENISKPDVQRFIKKLSSLNKGAYGFRLPSEAEWEYAARSGGKPEKYSGGTNLEQVAWYHGNSNRSTHGVSTKAPNELGLFDMTGNVYEWCEDTYMGWSYKKHKRNNPVFYDLEATNGVYRGGSWNSKPKDARSGARSFNVTFAKPPYLYPFKNSELGVRLVRSK
jgi:formylglycine-generating enzyme required for sulfatase activity